MNESIKRHITLTANQDKAWGTRKDPPKEIPMFYFGLNKTSKGDLYLTKKDAVQIVANVTARKLNLLADFEHSMAQPSATGAPSSAKFKLAVKADGLYAVKIEWSDRALEYFANREYFYYSPFVEITKR